MHPRKDRKACDLAHTSYVQLLPAKAIEGREREGSRGEGRRGDVHVSLRAHLALHTPHPTSFLHTSSPFSHPFRPSWGRTVSYSWRRSCSNSRYASPTPLHPSHTRQAQLGEDYELFLLEDLEGKPTVVVLPRDNANEGRISTVTEVRPRRV